MSPEELAYAASCLNPQPWSEYEFVAGPSRKFWYIRSAHIFTETRWGRIGTKGQSKVKKHLFVRSAAEARDRAVNEKMQKGYFFVRVKGDAPSPPPAPRVPQRDPLSGRIAVYALRDVHGTVGDRGMRGLVHARGQKQMLPAPIASELVTGSLDYGYWHPDDAELPSVTLKGEDISGLISRVSIGAGDAARAAVAMGVSIDQATRAIGEVIGQSAAPPRPRTPVFGVTPGRSAATPAAVPAAPPPPRKLETVPLGRFAGLADDEEEI